MEDKGIAKTIKNIGAIVGAIAAVLAAITYSTWFWVSKNSWVSTSIEIGGTYTHCLDFRFKHTTIAGSMIAQFEQSIPGVSSIVDQTNPTVFLVAAIGEGGVFDNQLALVDELRTFTNFSIFEGVTILNHVPDMDYWGEDEKIVGTVSFTLWWDEVAILPNVILADFKSLLESDIERKKFVRADSKSQDERCIVD